jgi:myo-inositol-1(or 4)-monophosphatase
VSEPLEIVEQIAREAGEILREGYGRRPAADAKRTATDLVTEFDRRSEERIVQRLHTAFPGDQILGEEGGLVGAAAPRRWLVDPLDGTTNYAHGLPIFCVSIGLEVDGALELALVYAPALALTFAARRGAGAACNGAPIQVSDETDLARSLLSTGFPYDRQTSPDNNFDQFLAFKRRAQAVRRLGSAALDLAFVARGSLDGFWEMKLKPWDLAAGALLVTEAGGRVTGWMGEPLSLDKGAIVASNGMIHAELLRVQAEVGWPDAVR